MKIHGTDERCLDSIAKNGFRIPTSFKCTNSDGKLTFGKAIYFSSYSSKADRYSHGKKPVLIVADVLLGKVKICSDSILDYTPERAQQDGINTIYFDGDAVNKERSLIHGKDVDEYAFYNTEQVYPKYAIFFEIIGLNEENLYFQYTG